MDYFINDVAVSVDNAGNAGKVADSYAKRICSKDAPKNNPPKSIMERLRSSL